MTRDAGIFRRVRASELAPGYYTAARVRSALGCVAYDFWPLCSGPGLHKRRRFRPRMGWLMAKEQARSFVLNALNFCRRDLRAHLHFMRRPIQPPCLEVSFTFSWTESIDAMPSSHHDAVPSATLRAWADDIDEHIRRDVYGLIAGH